MKSAIEVIANVQSVVLRVISISLSAVVSRYFHIRPKKERRRSTVSRTCRKGWHYFWIPSLHASSRRVDHGSGSSTRPMDIRIVISIPLAKKRLTTSADSREDCSARSTRFRQAGAADATEVRIVGRPGLQHQHQSVLILGDRHVRLAHRLQRVLAAPALRGSGEGDVHLVDAALHRPEVELLLRAEEPEEVGLRDPGRTGDVLGRGAVVALDGELVRGGIEHGGPPLLGRLAGRGGTHGK